LGKALDSRKEGDVVKFTILKDGVTKDIDVALGKKREKSFRITPLPNPDQLQSAIFKSWTEGR